VSSALPPLPASDDPASDPLSSLPDPVSAPTAAETQDDGSGITPPRSRKRSPRPLAEIMVELGIVSERRVALARQEAQESNKAAEQVLVDSRSVSGDDLARAIAERAGLGHVDLGIFKPDLAAVNLVPVATARRHVAAPIGFDEAGLLMVAMSDPQNLLALDDLRLITGHEIRPLVASEDRINGLLSRLSRLDDAVQEAVDEGGEEERDEEPAAMVRETASDSPTVKLVNSIISQAVEDGASDVHLEPERRAMRVRFRIDGVLAETTTIPARMVAGVVSRVKIMTGMDIAEKRVPQDGRVSLRAAAREIDVRAVTIPSVQGEGVVMRLLDKKQVMLTLDTLGMRDVAREEFEHACRQPNGAILVTGPTGSGKSTTLYAALNAVKTDERNFITIEDPVEYRLPGISQIQIRPKAGLTFAEGLRSMLRADPDVIMVGEIRDAETAKIAVESALTGHLLLSTLHTNDAPGALTRLTEMGVEPFLTASAVSCVVAQRLARVLCTECKTRTVLTPEIMSSLGFDAGLTFEAYEPVGCAACGHSGYRGRTGIYEVMSMNDRLRSMAVECASADELRAEALKNGMRLLRDDGLRKVRLGVTSMAEIARVS
jgi:type IV pilus assembly protein PilB